MKTLILILLATAVTSFAVDFPAPKEDYNLRRMIHATATECISQFGKDIAKHLKDAKEICDEYGSDCIVNGAVESKITFDEAEDYFYLEVLRDLFRKQALSETIYVGIYPHQLQMVSRMKKPKLTLTALLFIGSSALRTPFEFTTRSGDQAETSPCRQNPLPRHGAPSWTCFPVRS